MAFETNPRRDAWSTIAGFVFQVNVTILRWLNLQPNEILELERGEDIDTVQRELAAGRIDENRLLEQVKKRSTRLTLRSPEALEAIANFCDHQRNNTAVNLRFRYLTIATAGTEQGWRLEYNGITTWEMLRTGRLSADERSPYLSAIQGMLQSATKPPQIQETAWQCLQDRVASIDGLADLITNFEWGIEFSDYSALENQIRTELVQAGHATDFDSAELLFDRLFITVFKCLSKDGLKSLVPSDLQKQLKKVQLSIADRDLVHLVRQELPKLEQRLASVGQELAALTATVNVIAAKQDLLANVDFSRVNITTDAPELASPTISRSEVVNAVLTSLKEGPFSLYGEPGSGKTQLALLASKQLERSVTWLELPRDSNVAQTAAALDTLVAEVTQTARRVVLKSWYEDAAVTLTGHALVIDNLPRMFKDDPLSRRIELLGKALAARGIPLILISYYPLPRSVLVKAHFREVTAPRFTDAEINELLIAYGAPAKLATQLVTLIETATQKLPVLVVAVARHLAAYGWTFDWAQVESLLKAEFARAERSDSQRLIELTVSDTETRELLYRLVLTIGGFSRSDTTRIAKVPRAIGLANEKLSNLLGLWVQPFAGDKFILSPLVDPALSSNLDEKTRRGVHASLAMTIISRRTLQPIDVITCVHHFTSAGLPNQAVLVWIQALTAITAQEEFGDDWGVASLWSTSTLPDDIDINLRLYARALQALALATRGRDISRMFDEIDEMLQKADDQSWGAAMATSFLAIRLYRQYPARANAYLTKTLQLFRTAHLPDGTALPAVTLPLEGLFWATAHSAGSDSDVHSWIDAVRQLTVDQTRSFAASELAQDNSTILTDGIWLREYRKEESKRNWDHVERLVEKVEQLAKDKNLKVLEAAAIRTRIMITAEWRHDIDRAVKLAESSLQDFNSDDDRFLITEVTGRQLSYAGRSRDAIEWLQRARSFPISTHALWRRNVLITLAEEIGKSDAQLATKYTEEALELTRKSGMETSRLIEAEAEHGLALWNAGQHRAAFDLMSGAIQCLLDIQNDLDPYWKKLFLQAFYHVLYFSSMSYFREPPAGTQAPPQQGRFLGLDNIDTTTFTTAQQAFIRIRMAMWAESLGVVEAVGRWADEAFEVAKKVPDARTIYSLGALAVTPALLRGSYGHLAEIVLMMTSATAPSADSLTRIGVAESEKQQRIRETFAHPAHVASAWITVVVPLALQLATLGLSDRPEAEIAASLNAFTVGLAGTSTAGTTDALRALIDNVDARELRGRADAIASDMNQTAARMVYMIGVATKAALKTALLAQSWLAPQLERIFSPYPSTRNRIILPYFAAFWTKAVNSQSYLFRTAEAYTKKAVQEALSANDPIKRLLSAMFFCIGAEMPKELAHWTDSTLQAISK